MGEGGEGEKRRKDAQRTATGGIGIVIGIAITCSTNRQRRGPIQIAGGLRQSIDDMPKRTPDRRSL